MGGTLRDRAGWGVLGAIEWGLGLGLRKHNGEPVSVREVVVTMGERGGTTTHRLLRTTQDHPQWCRVRMVIMMIITIPAMETICKPFSSKKRAKRI